MTPLPTGIVTLLFTDIEGSVRLLLRLGPRYAAAFAAGRELALEQATAEALRDTE
jgi:class 3 adenylate cyclase